GPGSPRGRAAFRCPAVLSTEHIHFSIASVENRIGQLWFWVLKVGIANKFDRVAITIFQQPVPPPAPLRKARP
ncbi:MAG: hypothetical protein ACLGJC_03815, partial [Alphaproteobacteria bacterium]